MLKFAWETNLSKKMSSQQSIYWNNESGRNPNLFLGGELLKHN